MHLVLTFSDMTFLSVSLTFAAVRETETVIEQASHFMVRNLIVSDLCLKTKVSTSGLAGNYVQK